jgi:probable HAF family extracellular repeat protein
VTTLDPEGMDFSAAAFLNSKGDVVGFARKGTEPRHGFVWRNGSFQFIDVPEAVRAGRVRAASTPAATSSAPSTTTSAPGISAASSSAAASTRGSTCPGTRTASPYAQGINNGGVVVGYYAKN